MNEAAKALGARMESRQLTAFGLKKPESWLIAHDNRILTKVQNTTLERLLNRRLKQEPMPYILGTAPFFGREFLVDKRVLIPRPETEDLVEEALKIPATHYVDIGTGSGAIGVTLAAESPRSSVFASDANAKTLAVAKKNARKLAPGRIRFFHGPLLPPLLFRAITKSSKASKSSKSSICIVANLPYLPPSDKKIMPTSVTKYEPHKALFTDDDGMKLNKRLLVQISRLPTPDSRLSILLEFDPPQSKKLSAFAKSLFPDADISIIRDRCGRERILRISLKSEG